jgi:restriction system protein
MARKKRGSGPQFVRFFGPVIEALKELGGSGRPTEVKDWIAEKLEISDEEQNELLKSGVSRFSNQVDWARLYLVKAGYLGSSTRGVWNLTEKGRSASLTQAQALAIFREVQKKQVAAAKAKTEADAETDESLTPEDTDHRTALLKILQELPPSGFERLCQRLLRESGFESVIVQGRSGDGGIDGIGMLQVNPFVSFKVLFQAKRYGASNSVGAPQVRDFRGAMMGRADKGIILTTSTFTADAKREAVRDGAVPIELVGGEELLDMFESLELGLTPKKAYEIDEEFFNEFKETE